MGFSLRKHWRKQASIYSKVQQRSSSESHQLILEEEIYSKQDPCRMTARDLEDRSRPRVMKWSKDIIVNAVMEDSTKSTRQLSSDYNVSHATVWCILNTENFHPYKAMQSLFLSDGDDDRHLQFLWRNDCKISSWFCISSQTYLFWWMRLCSHKLCE